MNLNSILKKEISLRCTGDWRPVFEHFYGRAISGRKAQVVVQCCFHNDDHPSLSINLEKGLFHCFGCGSRGDAFTFAAHALGLDYRRDFSQVLVAVAEAL